MAMATTMMTTITTTMTTTTTTPAIDVRWLTCGWTQAESSRSFRPSQIARGCSATGEQRGSVFLVKKGSENTRW